MILCEIERYEREAFGIPADLSVTPAFFHCEKEKAHKDDAVLCDPWAVQSSGIPAVDMALGNDYADALVRWAREHKSPHIISYIVAIIRTREANGQIACGDIEDAFFNRLCALAYCGALN